MYVNESGIGEEIRERIESLKVAAELSGQNFDEKNLLPIAAILPKKIMKNLILIIKR